jgi:hypothetical protein
MFQAVAPMSGKIVSKHVIEHIFLFGNVDLNILSLHHKQKILINLKLKTL